MFGLRIGYSEGAWCVGLMIQQNNITIKRSYGLRGAFRYPYSSKGSRDMSSKCKSTFCKCIPVIIGVLLGAAMAVLFAFGYAEAIHAIFPVTAVVGLVFTVLLSILAVHQRYRCCLCEYLPLTLFSSLALTVLSVLSMATTVTPEFIGFTVLVFLGTSSLFISVIGLFMLVKCLLGCHCVCDERC